MIVYIAEKHVDYEGSRQIVLCSDRDSAINQTIGYLRQSGLGRHESVSVSRIDVGPDDSKSEIIWNAVRAGRTDRIIGGPYPGNPVDICDAYGE